MSSLSPPPLTRKSPRSSAARNFARILSRERREGILQILRGTAVWFDPPIRITECRDPKDDKYLELALAAGAETIVSSDDDLLVLHPWRGVHIRRPADYLAS